LPRNFVKSFLGRRWVLHALAIVVTYVLVATNFDWLYYTSVHKSFFNYFAWPAVALGGVVPILLPLALIALGIIRKDKQLSLTGWVLGQAGLLGSIISSIYKAFTGRIPPVHAGVVDISHGFQFGWLREGIFWGWPSSHTTIAFAMSVCFITLCPNSRWKWWILLYALYIGLGVSLTIHWFSEFVAGALIGTAIGLAVGKSSKSIMKG